MGRLYIWRKTMQNDIIAAIATSRGEAGIAIVRLSGQGSTQLLDRHFKGKRSLTDAPARTLCHGYLVSSDREILDEVLAVRFIEGKSYTGEESAEIHCHGGLLPAQKCLDLMLANGAHLAKPGEFTQRAFLSGRIDLLQAEGVLGIIRARSSAALGAAERVLEGKLGKEVRSLMQDITNLAAEVEVHLDFPEDEPGEENHLSEEIACVCEQTEKILKRCQAGALLQSGATVALLGAPNVGKSSLLNAMLEEERAIVTPIAGTTRDRIEGTLIHNGIPLRLVDTAGIHAAKDPIEEIGVERSLEMLHSSAVCVWVIDASIPLSNEERQHILSLQEKPHIIVLNKNDLNTCVTPQDIRSLFMQSPIIEISAMQKQGVEDLKELIVKHVARDLSLEEGFTTASHRFLEELQNCRSHLQESFRIAQSASSQVDAIAASLSYARQSLANLLGMDAGEELLNRVFSQFCVGK